MNPHQYPYPVGDAPHEQYNFAMGNEQEQYNPYQQNSDPITGFTFAHDGPSPESMESTEYMGHEDRDALTCNSASPASSPSRSPLHTHPYGTAQQPAIVDDSQYAFYTDSEFMNAVVCGRFNVGNMESFPQYQHAEAPKSPNYVGELPRSSLHPSLHGIP